MSITIMNKQQIWSAPVQDLTKPCQPNPVIAGLVFRVQFHTEELMMVHN